MIRFRHSLRIAPGVRLNLSKGGAGLSVGPRGLHVGVGPRGAYTSAGLPGTGIYAVTHLRTAQGEHRIVRDGSISWVGAFAIVTIAYWLQIIKNC